MRWYNKTYQPQTKPGENAEQSGQQRKTQNPYRVPEATKSATHGRGLVLAFASLALAAAGIVTRFVAPLSMPWLLAVLALGLGALTLAIVSIRQGYRGLPRTIALVLSIVAIGLFALSFGPYLQMRITTPDYF